MFNKLILLLACFFVSLIKFTLRTYPYLNETINITRTYPDLPNRQITCCTPQWVAYQIPVSREFSEVSFSSKCFQQKYYSLSIFLK